MPESISSIPDPDDFEAEPKQDLPVWAALETFQLSSHKFYDDLVDHYVNKVTEEDADNAASKIFTVEPLQKIFRNLTQVILNSEGEQKGVPMIKTIILTDDNSRVQQFNDALGDAYGLSKLTAEQLDIIVDQLLNPEDNPGEFAIPNAPLGYSLANFFCGNLISYANEFGKLYIQSHPREATNEQPTRQDKLKAAGREIGSHLIDSAKIGLGVALGIVAANTFLRRKK